METLKRLSSYQSQEIWQKRPQLSNDTEMKKRGEVAGMWRTW